MSFSAKNFDPLSKTGNSNQQELCIKLLIMKTNQKIVLVTGASAGIGLETATYLSGQGYIVYGAARRTEKLRSLVSKGVHPVTLDVTDESSMSSAVDGIIAKEGRIDILINNAGFGSYGAIEDVQPGDAKYQLEVNLFGAARMIQLVLPNMRKNNWGKIVNISSIGGKIATPFGGWYHASKFALEGLSDSLRNEVKQFGIDVILIEPGGIKSEWSGIAFNSLVRVSGNTAYAKLAENFTNAFKGTEGKNPSPEIIAKLIYKAINEKRPKARYSAGYMAKPSLIARKILPDGIMDKLIMNQVKQMAKS